MPKNFHVEYTLTKFLSFLNNPLFFPLNFYINSFQFIQYKINFSCILTTRVKLVAKRIGPPLNTNNLRRNMALMMTLHGNSNSSSNRSFLSLESNLKICYFNIAEISISKSEYRARLMHDEDIDIVTAQETHAESEENLCRRRTIPVYSNVNGIATCVKASYSNCHVLYKVLSHNVHIYAVKVYGTI
jgi:hypothetical protein